MTNNLDILNELLQFCEHVGSVAPNPTSDMAYTFATRIRNRLALKNSSALIHIDALTYRSGDPCPYIYFPESISEQGQHSASNGLFSSMEGIQKQVDSINLSNPPGTDCKIFYMRPA